MLVKLVKVFPLVSRQYTDRQGQTQVFKSKGFIINAGDGNIYAEAIQETATAIEEILPKDGECAFVQLAYAARTYKTAQGEERISNEVTIRQLIMG